MRIVLVFAMAVLVTACASREKAQPSADLRDVDEASMQAVEEAAASRGVKVYWMNPPRKPSPVATR